MPTNKELDEALTRMLPYLRGYPRPMIDSRYMRKAANKASVRDLREIDAEELLYRYFEGKDHNWGWTQFVYQKIDTDDDEFIRSVRYALGYHAVASGFDHNWVIETTSLEFKQGYEDAIADGERSA